MLQDMSRRNPSVIIHFYFVLSVQVAADCAPSRHNVG